MPTTTTPACIACQTTEAAAFVTLVPCHHIVCKECHHSPLVLISVYGCPACGSSVTSAEDLLVAPHQKSEPTVVEDEEGQVEGEKRGVENAFATTSSTTSGLYYGLSSTGSSLFDNAPATTIPLAPAPVVFNLCDTVPTLEECAWVSDDVEGLEAEVSTTATSSDAAASEGNCVVSSSGVSTSDSTNKKRRRQKRRNSTPADKWATPQKVKVVVPLGCPDHLRPRARPEPRTCREAGRTESRERLLHKNHKDKEHSMHVMKKHCKNMTCF